MIVRPADEVSKDRSSASFPSANVSLSSRSMSNTSAGAFLKKPKVPTRQSPGRHTESRAKINLPSLAARVGKKSQPADKVTEKSKERRKAALERWANGHVEQTPDTESFAYSGNTVNSCSSFASPYGDLMDIDDFTLPPDSLNTTPFLNSIEPPVAVEQYTPPSLFAVTSPTKSRTIRITTIRQAAQLTVPNRQRTRASADGVTKKPAESVKTSMEMSLVMRPRQSPAYDIPPPNDGSQPEEEDQFESRSPEQTVSRLRRAARVAGPQQWHSAARPAAAKDDALAWLPLREAGSVGFRKNLFRKLAGAVAPWVNRGSKITVGTIR